MNYPSRRWHSQRRAGTAPLIVVLTAQMQFAPLSLPSVQAYGLALLEELKAPVAPTRTADSNVEAR
jgi:hypothetical protein